MRYYSNQTFFKCLKMPVFYSFYPYTAFSYHPKCQKLHQNFFFALSACLLFTRGKNENAEMVGSAEMLESTLLEILNENVKNMGSTVSISL